MGAISCAEFQNELSCFLCGLYKFNNLHVFIVEQYIVGIRSNAIRRDPSLSLGSRPSVLRLSLEKGSF